jgi:hypothetical protein
MKTITIEQQYNINTKMTHVTCEYRGKWVMSEIVDPEYNDTLENSCFYHLRRLGFTHWKSKNGLVARRKI